MTGVGCKVQCSCGGYVFRLREDDVLYVLTENETIIFLGICGGCGETVRVERDIRSLFLMCPNKKDTKVN